MTGSKIRVASYNVRAFKQDRAALRRVIQAIDPDVLLLQEVPRHPFSGHRVAAFAQELGLTWGGGRRYRMSTTLMTALRLDVLDFEHHSLPVQARDEPRGYAVATVALPGHQPLRVASLHMSLRATDRRAHVPELLNVVSGDETPVVVGGDLNETPGHDVWTGLGRELIEVSPDADTFNSSAPSKRIDAIFASATLPARVPTIEWDSKDLPAATDHLPVVVDLDVGVLAETAPRAD